MKSLHTLFCICFSIALASAASAESLVETSGSASRETRREFLFTVAPDSELTITLQCTSNAARQGLYRVYFYSKRSEHAWRQLREMTISFTETQAEVSDTFRLPPGEYKVLVTARFMDYVFRLADDVPEEGSPEE